MKKIGGYYDKGIVSDLFGNPMLAITKGYRYRLWPRPKWVGVNMNDHIRSESLEFKARTPRTYYSPLDKIG